MDTGRAYPRYGGAPTAGKGLCLYRDGGMGDTGSAADRLSLDRDESATGRRRALLCSACQAPVTTSAERFEKRGKHLHTFFNPAGVVYEIGCFRKASGCLPYGVPSSEFAWFPGYRWQVAYCRSCQQHLGWRFIADDDFFGLVVTRLIER